MTAPPVTLAGDARTRADLAAALLFTTPPTDRALLGWCGADWAVAFTTAGAYAAREGARRE